MPRPPIEWPIPVYVTEHRERLLFCFRAPAPSVARLVPAPMYLETVSGQALLLLALGGARCHKAAGRTRALASEFRAAELLTPARWPAACRRDPLGLHLLQFHTTSAGLRRFVHTALGFEQSNPAARLTAEPLGPNGDGHLSIPYRTLARSQAESEWPADSLFDSSERAEALLLHPEYYYIPDQGRREIQAVPLHQYVRKSTVIPGPGADAEPIAELLGVAPSEVSLDHIVLQRRCTLTWSFPPERIPMVRGSRGHVHSLPFGHGISVLKS